MKGLLEHIMLLLFGMVLVIQPLYSKDNPEWKISLDTLAIRIGEQTNARLTLSGQGSIPHFQWPVYYDTLVPGIEILSQSSLDTLIDKKKNRYEIRRAYLITSFDSGFYSFDNIPLRLFAEGDTLIIAAPEVSLHVFTLTVNPEDDIRDIAGIIPFGLRFRDLIPYIIALLLISAVLLTILYLKKRRKTGKSILSVFSKPPVPPHIRAMEELEKLRRKKLWQEGKVKAYHSELSEILRTYLEGRFKIQALEMVSTEILTAMATDPEAAPYIPSLEKTMMLADLVKFAKHLPLPDENEKCFQEVRDFVQASRPLSEIQAERQESTMAASNKKTG
jgi:hypothetical protein